jgi:hypothetical protein
MGKVLEAQYEFYESMGNGRVLGNLAITNISAGPLTAKIRVWVGS